MKSSNALQRIVAILVAAIALGISGSASTIAIWVEPAHAADPFLRRTAAVQVVEEVGPAVVNITSDKLENPPYGEQNQPRGGFYRDFLRPKWRAPKTQMLGSGIIIDSDRHVLTNAHVITGASRIRVTLADGREFDATLVGAALNNDLAVLQIQSDEELPWVPPGTSSDLMVGEPVIAIGNPFGLFSNSVTTGVLSAVDRSLNIDGDYYYGFLQTDASINPGNSGGPLLNAEGTLIGINTAIYQGAQGIGLAIPIDVAKRVVRELLQHGKIAPAWLGLEFQSLDPALQDVLTLPQGVSGALITDVAPGSPAKEAGLKRGDLVISIDGNRIQGVQSFFEALRTTLVGQTLILEIWRHGASQKIQIVGANLPDHVIGELAQQLLGMRLEPISSGGFEIGEIDSRYPAAYAGLQPGDIVRGINGLELSNMEDLRRTMLALRREYTASGGKNRAMLMVQRGNEVRHFVFPSLAAFEHYQRMRGGNRLQ
jgi:serine protease Do